MRVVEIIPARMWRNTVTGATASVFGAVPYVSDADKPNWRIETVGYTWRMSNGTIGLGRPPAKTLAEAQQVMNTVNGRVNT